MHAVATSSSINGSGVSRAFLFVYVSLMPFMSALAPSEWTPLPLILLVVLFPVIHLSRSGPGIGGILRRDAAFVLAWILGVVAIANSPLGYGGKNFNYSAAMVVSYVLFLVTVRAWIVQSSIDWNVIAKSASVALAILSVAVILEFISASFFGVFISDLIPYAHDDLNIASLVSDSFRRPRGFSTEPGFTALAYECLWPLTFLGRRTGLARNLLYAVAFALLASAAATVGLVTAIAMVWLFKRRDFSGLLKGLVVALVLFTLFGMTETGSEIWQAAIGRKLDVIGAQAVGGDDSITVLDRVTTYLTGFELLKGFPLGLGWGTLGEAFARSESLPGVGLLSGSGMLSLYLDVAVAAGWVGLALFAYFIGRRIIAVLRSGQRHAPFVAVAVCSVAIHHLLITELQFPFLWFALAVADKLIDETGNGIPEQGYVLLRVDTILPSTTGGRASADGPGETG